MTQRAGLAPLSIDEFFATACDVLGRQPTDGIADCTVLEFAADSLGVLVLECWLEDHGVVIESLDQVASAVMFDLYQQYAAARVAVPVDDDLAAPQPYHSIRRGVRLVAAVPEHYGDLLALLGENGMPFAGGGGMRSAEDVLGSLFASSLSTLLVAREGEPGPIGFASAYAADLRGGHVKLAVSMSRLEARPRDGVAASVLFLDHLFSEWPLRKVYLEVASPTMLSHLGSLERYCEHEATLRDHVFIGGRHEDLHIFAVTRDTWSALDQRIAESLQ